MKDWVFVALFFLSWWGGTAAAASYAGVGAGIFAWVGIVLFWMFVFETDEKIKRNSPAYIAEQQKRKAEREERERAAKRQREIDARIASDLAAAEAKRAEEERAKREAEIANLRGNLVANGEALLPKGCGYVYILSNPSMRGIYKVGMTARTVGERIKELNNTALPTPYRLVFCVPSYEPAQAEKRVHLLLRKRRVSEKREHFRLADSDVSKLRVWCDQNRRALGMPA